MSKTASNISPGLGGLTKSSEIRQRIFFVIFALIVFRLGSFITLPGIDPAVMSFLFEQQKGSILDMFNMFSGGALSRMSIFALGVMPYISASIIIQMMTHIYAPLIQLRKEGERGRKTITKYTRYFTLVLALLQSMGVMNALMNQNTSSTTLVLDPGLGFFITGVVTLVTGTMFLIWLGEQITERGIGNGISIIIFAGIVAGLPSAIGGTIELARNEKKIGSSLEVEVSILTSDTNLIEIISSVSMNEICIVSALILKQKLGDIEKNYIAKIENPSDDCNVYIYKTNKEKCLRCWQHKQEVKENNGLCNRCKNSIEHII